MKERIRKLRKTLGLTQQKFADRLGIRQNTITKYETGRGEPTAAIFSLICREYNVNEEWLRTGKGEMFNSELLDDLDKLIKESGLPKEVRILVDKFMDLAPDAQQAVIDYVRSVALAIVQDQAAPSDKDAQE